MKKNDDMGIIYQRYYRDLYRFCRSICSNPDTAEDICHETFYKAMKSTNTYKGDCKVISWLCQIAKNTYISYLRKEKRLVKSDEVEQLMEHMAGTENSLQDKVEDAESAREIQDIMNSLEPPYDEVFRLKVVEEYSYKEIGDLYGKSENWARVTYFRAKQRIVEQLKKEGKYE